MHSETLSLSPQSSKYYTVTNDDPPPHYLSDWDSLNLQYSFPQTGKMDILPILLKDSCED